MINSDNIDNGIHTIDETICRNIDMIDADQRGFPSQNILAQLRNFVEHIMLKIYANGQNIEITYNNIKKAIDLAKREKGLIFLKKFHTYLQESASHYTVDEEASERLMLKYCKFLFQIKNFLKEKYSMEVLRNLDKLSMDTDSDLKEYYGKIATKVDRCGHRRETCEYDDRFYIRKVKPFFVDRKIYYEVTFFPVNEKDKSSGTTAFTDLEIPDYYATWLYVDVSNIEILDKTMPINIIVGYETSIRPCEIENFSAILGKHLNVRKDSEEYKGLMNFLTETGFNLTELLDLDDDRYFGFREQILSKAKAIHFFDTLDECRKMLRSYSPGSNVLRYLLLHLNNKIIKDQKDKKVNDMLSGLYLKNGCIPFDQMPFNSSPVGHNTRLGDLLECIGSTRRMHELLARRIRNNTESKGQLYTPIEDLAGFKNIDELIRTYNSNLWRYHGGRRLKERNKHIFIEEYENDTVYIIRKLKDRSAEGIQNYSDLVESWVQSKIHPIDCEQKKTALTQMFCNSMVALIYGPAGTGKTTYINHVSQLFLNETKLYLAHTNPAVDNLRRRVTAPNSTHMTITRFLKKRDAVAEYDMLIIDECSTVSNKDMRGILEKARFKLLILVGDTYQIEAIRFGNWFDAIRKFLPKTSVFELTTAYRSENEDLLELWKKVRRMDEKIIEHIAKGGYSARLDDTIFKKAEEDEIILCLNYSGLYGINNINRFLQQSNPNTPVKWGIQEYKIGDPILFSESDRFGPSIYNNMKGKIADIQKSDDKIGFGIELDKVMENPGGGHDFEILNISPRKSMIRFSVNKYENTDEDDDLSSATVPFQVAYAVSIHKAQGLEYDSVKIVITDEIDELITHSIFYTAITRARTKLKIYWSPEVEKKVLDSIRPKNNDKDVGILSQMLVDQHE